MAEHANTQIRKAIEQRLRAALPTLTVVPALRAERAFQSNEIPLATVQVGDVAVPVSAGPTAGKPLRRNVTAVIQLLVQGDLDTIEDDLSALQVEVEAALDVTKDPILRGLNDWVYGGSIPAVGNPDAGTAGTNLTYTCWLRTDAGRPDIIKF